MGNCPHRHAQREAAREAEIKVAKADEVLVTLDEVQQNGWLIIHGKVYNPEKYLDDHPGGGDLLLGFGGRDVTAEFELLRHSDFAEQILKGLYVGVFDSSGQQVEQSSLGRRSSAGGKGHGRQLHLTGGRQSTSSWSDCGSFWSVHDRGFLPKVDPVQELPNPWQRLLDLCDILPALNASYSLRDYLHRHVSSHLPNTGEEVKACIENLSEGQLECLHSTLGYVCLAYLRPPPVVYDVLEKPEEASQLSILSQCEELDTLPPFLSLPWLMTSKMLKRQPMLDYAGCVLNNWERIDSDGPISPDNVRLLRRFTGLVDEEWFFKTHIIIESEGSHIVSALRNLSEAMQLKDTKYLLQELHDMEEALWRVASVCLPIMYARSQENHALLCEPFMFFFRLRPYIKSLDLKFQTDEEGPSHSRHLHGPSGAMSTILPSVDALLGIRNTSSELRETVEAFEIYVPEAHRVFHGEMCSSLTVREFIMSQREEMEDMKWFALAAAFNACVSRVLDFRWRHWNFVHNFIVRPASDSGGAQPGSVCPAYERSNDQLPARVTPTRDLTGTGGTQFDYLQQHITDSQRSRIDLSSTSEPQPTPAISTPELRARSAPDADSFEPIFWDPDGRNGFLANRPALLEDWGRCDAAPLPGCYALQRLTWMVPTLCWDLGRSLQEHSHPFMVKCESMRESIEALTQLDEAGEMPVASLSECDLERTWALLMIVVSAYRCMARSCEEEDICAPVLVCPAGGQALAKQGFKPCPAGLRCSPEIDTSLCSWLHNAILAMAPLVGRPPSLIPEYSELVLNNWCLNPDCEEDGNDFVVSRHTIDQISPITRFLALPDEEWYRKFHIVLEAEGGRAMSTASKSMRRAIMKKDGTAVIETLRQLSDNIESLVDFQRRQFDQKDSRGEAIMMTRLRKFVGQDLSDDDYASWLYVEGSSPLVPALHAFLGLESVEKIDVLQPTRASTAIHMNQNHKEFLDKLSQPSMSVKAYLLKEWRFASVERIASLEDAFNGCLDSFSRYILARQRMVLRMFPENGRIRHLSEQQDKLIRKGRLPLLQMRRTVDALRMQTRDVPISNALRQES